MRYKLLGNSGLRVSELCLGTMTFGQEWGWGADRATSQAIVEAFAEAGGNFLDTANRYTEGTSERYVGEIVAPQRDYWVVATKYTLSSDPRDPNAAGNQRKNLVQALEASLKRLRTDYVDLLWVHAWDGGRTPVQEVMRGLDDLVRAGKVLYVGISDAPAWWVAQANTLAELRGWTPFVGLQIQYSLIERTPERELLPMAQALDLAVTPWGPLAGGVLTGKYNPDAAPGEADNARYRVNEFGAGYLNERSYRIADAVGQVAREAGRSPAQVALSWLRRPGGPVMIPILGARNRAQIEDNLGSLELALTPEQRGRLDEVSAIELGFPHDFLSGDYVRKLVHGEHFESVDVHR
jgi:aryl-alcohol dehydrogenase-like predicted oxidoreductase